MVAPLNPVLYRLLKRKFGSVKIASEGESYIAGNEMWNPVTDRFDTEVIQTGEYYQVCCPFCSDTKFRLYINHMWCKESGGSRLMHMAICFNDTNCLRAWAARQDLLEEITELEDDVLFEARIKPGKEVDPEDVEISWPGPCTRVDRLPRKHLAVQYLIGRGFDPERIGKFYNVRYCHDSFRWMAKDRLIIPVYSKRKMVGWQGRFTGEMKWSNPNAPPKYYTSPGMPRRLVLYNIANAARYRTGVIVEGPTDVWAFGPMAVCTLGSTMTARQQSLFKSAFKGRSAILLYDPEEYEKPGVKKLMNNFGGKNVFSDGFAAVKLPVGTDPGRYTGTDGRRFMREFVAEEARKQGVRVSWSKR